MNRVIVLPAILVVSCLAGVISVSVGEESGERRSAQWIATEIPDRSTESQAIQWLSSSGRWGITETLVQGDRPTGGFADSYRLVAVVSNESIYALLEPVSLNNQGTESISRVVVGDRLPNDWIVSEIENAAVVATREDESERVELFPSR